MPPRRAIPSAHLPSTLVCGSYLALTVWNTVCPALCLIAIAALSCPLIPTDGTATSKQNSVASIEAMNEWYSALALQNVYVCVRRLDSAQTGKYYQCTNSDPAIVSTTQMCACGYAPTTVSIEAAAPVTVCAPDADARKTWATECAATDDEVSTCYRLLGYWTGKPEVRSDTAGRRWYNLSFLRDMNTSNLLVVWLICMVAPLGLVGGAALCCSTTPTRYAIQSAKSC
jgi:hypothetical protein